MAEAQYRKIGEMELRLSGVSATVENAEPVVPKHTPGGIRVLVRAGGVDLSLSDLSRFLGANFSVRGDLSGPGLSQPIALPALQPGEELPADPLVLPVPPLPVAGNYRLSNLRIVANGRTVLDVDPSNVPLRVIDQILVTQVTTRALTLDEIRGKGIVLDSDDYLGFEFTMGFKLDSKAVDLKFPVVFDRQGVALPQPLSPPLAPSAAGVAFLTIVPLLLEAESEEGVREELKFTSPTGVTKPITIPAVLVIPGNVGYLKQFFSAQLYVSNGAPVGSGLNVRDIKATLKLPPGADLSLGTIDDPLALPEIEREGQVITQPLSADVKGIGADGLPDTDDDVDELAPAEQGQSEFLIRGELEGFHQIGFDLTAKLLGLPIGPVTVRGKAMGGVLVRNPYFNVTFTVPSVVRSGERFKMRATVTNIGKGIGNNVSMTLDSSRMSGLLLEGEGTRTIPTLKPGDARGLEFEFTAQRTGKVVATYLRFDTQAGNGGKLNFTIGVGERNVPLSPDTLVLPASTDGLPPAVVEAAMRVLGQAWSVANAPAGTLPQGVTRVNGQLVVKKALALAEAGLRVTLGQSSDAAVRDLLYDFFSGSPVDPGFDQLLRTTEAGQDFVLAVGAALSDSATQAGGGPGYEFETARLLASAAPFTTFAWDGGAGQLAVLDGAGRITSRSTDPLAPISVTTQNVVGAVLSPLGSDAVLGILTQPTAGPYTWEFRSAASSLGSLSASFPRPDGSFGRVSWSGLVGNGSVTRVVLDSDGAASLHKDANGDGLFETIEALSVDTLPADGPRLVAAAVIGPETLDGAGPWGFHTALVFDRVVGEESAADTAKYTVPDNTVRSARRQLSGRLVFGGLTLPEGPYVPSQVSIRGIEDVRGVVGPDTTVALGSRLENIGAVVSGRVLDAEGGPLVGRTVTYSQQNDPTCQTYPPIQVGLAGLITGSSGEFELRYVNQDPCGGGFKVETLDPTTGALRSQGRGVREAGEQIVADFVMLAAGSVTGVVKNLSGQAVPGAYVVVLSQTETQVGGTAFTDALGRYTVSGITVGPVVVRAAKGNGVGSSSGRIDRPSVPAVINLTLDGGSVKANGVIRKVEGGVTSVAVGAVVTYKVAAGVMAAGLTDSQGRYSFSDLPVGAFTILAQATSRDSAQVTGVALAGETIVRDISVEIAPPQSLGYIEGHVRMPDGSAAPQAIVSTGAAAVLTDALGAFRVPVTPQGSAHFLTATTRDRKRTGQATVSLSSSGQTVTGVLITLSGLGSAEFTVLDPFGQPMVAQTVKLLDSQVDPCGRTAALTDSLGRARFTGLGLGAFTAQVVTSGEITDSARAEVSISGDGQTGFAILRVETRASSITGIVRDDLGQPVFGADVVLSSPVFVNDPFDFVCGLQTKVSHRARTGLDGRYRFSGVHPGVVYISASQDFFPTPVSRQTNLTPGQESELDIVLKNTISGKISGHVFEPDGITSAGAGVEVTMNGLLPDVTVTTNAAGYFEFAKIFPEGGYTLTARDPITGLLERSGIYVAAHVDAIHDVRLKGKTKVQVRVTDALAQPVGQAYVSLKETLFPNRTFEGVVAPSNQGLIEFPGVFEGPVAIEARDPFGRGGRTSLTIPTGVQTVEATVRLTTTGTIRGRFLKADGTAIPFGGVKLFVSGRLLGQVTASGSDPAGGFAFTYVPSGDFRLEALDPLSGRTGIATGSIENEGQIVDINVIAQSVGTVAGLVSGDGQPRPGARVELVSGPYSATTITDSEGRYSVQGVPEGRVVVSADTDNGFLRASSSGTLQGEGSTLTLDVVLRSTGTLRGQVFKAGGVIPAGVVAVSLYVGGVGGGSVTGSTDEDGTFEFTHVPAGLAQVQVEALGSEDFASGAVEVPALGEAQLNLTLNGIGGLNGQGLDSAGVGVAGTVALFGGPPNRGYYYIIYLDSQGRFQLPKVLAGPFTAHLTVAVSGGPTLYGVATGNVVDGQTTSVEIRVQDSGTITGRVLRNDGVTPAYGAKVTAELGGYASANTQAQSDGRFTIRGATLGNFVLRFSDPVTTGVGRATGTVPANGASVDVGDVILDDSPVQIVSVEPADLSVGVGVNQLVRLTFTDPLASTDGIVVNSSLGYHGIKSLSTDGRAVTITGPWPDSKDLVITANTAVTDIFGRHPSQTFTSRFKTQDLSPPSVTSVSPLSGAIQVVSDVPVVVNFSEALDSAADLTNLIKVSVGAAVLPGVATLTGASQATFVPNSPLPINSVLSIQVNGARDLTGNTQTSPFNSTFKSIDTIPPAITPVAPTAGSWVLTRRPLIYAAITDGLSGVDPTSGTMRLDNVEVAAAKAVNSVSYTPPADLADGQHTVEATARDMAGNFGPLSWSFGVDATPPVAPEITSGVTGGASVAGTITLAATSFDATSGLAKIEILEGAAVRATLLPPNFSLSVNTHTLSEGAHTFTARAVDMAGNTSGLGSPVSFFVDNAVLSLAITAPSNGLRIRDSVVASASTSEPVARVTFALGATVAEDQTVPYSATVDSSALAEGNHTLTVTAYAFSGEPTFATVSVFVDRTPPAAVNREVITAEDQGTGLAQVVGRSGAAAGAATVEVRKCDLCPRVVAQVAGDGSFATLLPAVVGDRVFVAAVDSVGNTSAWVELLLPVTRLTSAEGLPQTGLALWVKADAGVTADTSGSVSTWADQSLKHNNLQSTNTSKPSLIPDGFNGYPVLRFNGVSSFMTFTRMVATIGSVFLVLKEDASATTTVARSALGDEYVPNFKGSATALFGSSDSADVKNGTYINGVPVAGGTVARPKAMSIVSVVSPNPTASLLTANYLGSQTAAGSAHWWGDIAEVIIYDRRLSDSERAQVETYLAQKYRPYIAAVSTPRISPAGGVFTGSTTVSIASQPGASIHYTIDGSEPTEASSLYTEPFALSETKTVKARAFKSGLDPSGIAVATLVETGVAPPLRDNMLMWVRADAGVSTDVKYPSVWADQSKWKNDLLQTTATSRPMLVPDGFNGHPVMRFDGVSSFMTFKSRMVATIGSVFLVLKEDASATTTVARSALGDEYVPNFKGSATALFGSSDSADVKNGTYINGVPVAGGTVARPKAMSIVSVVSPNPTASLLTANYLGSQTAAGSAHWWGDIAEVIIYDYRLSDSERAQVEAYLAQKYRPYIAAVSTPRISPAGGVFTGSTTVSIASQPGASIHYTIDGSEPTEASSLYTEPFALSETKTVKARAFKSGLDPSGIAVATLVETGVAPPLRDNMLMWVRADAGVSTDVKYPSVWADQSKWKNDLLQTTATSRPMLVPDGFNGHPVMRFDGVSSFMTFKSRMVETIGSVFLVLKEDASATTTVARSALGDEYVPNFKGSATALFGSSDTADVKNGTYINGLLVSGATLARPKTMSIVSVVSASGTARLTANYLGSQTAAGSAHWWGDIAEVIIYDQALSTPNRQAVEAYLKAKYQIP